MPRISRSVRNLFRKQQGERDLDAELGSFLATLIDEKVAQGMGRPELRRRALLEIHGIDQIKEAIRDARMGDEPTQAATNIRYN